MNCNTTHYRANSSSVPGDPTVEIERLSDVPSRSLLSRITDHYMQILANQAPIGFEAEFVNQRGATILYRGILLPFSSDDESIDFIYGVINWKELADSHAADELLLEIDQALDARPAIAPRRHEDALLTDWADGPGTIAANDVDSVADGELPRPSFGLRDEVVPAPAPAYPAEMHLADWLAAAREMAQAARSGEERTRSALYEAVGRAWDFALAAAAEPDEFAALLEETGLTVQDRAPMTPVVKLVFGADYDKTRLTEYAAVLAYAERNNFARGTLADHLRAADGGLKGVVAVEREFRRQQAGEPVEETRRGPRQALARKLRSLEPRDFSVVEHDGSEFALVMIRRTETGEVVVLGEVPDNVSLVEKAARELLG